MQDEHVEAGVGLGALVAGLGALVAEFFKGRVNPVVLDAHSLLGVRQSAIELEDLAGVIAVFDVFQYAHV